MGEMPAADFDVDAPLVRRLLRQQFPSLADLPIVEVANGWDNVMFRLGDDLVVRVPRRTLAVRLIEHEQRCLEVLAPRLNLPVPAPLHHGAPSDLFPMPWSVCPWFPGVSAADSVLADPPAEAHRLGVFLTALHQPAPADAPDNPFRGHHIADNDARFRAVLAELDDDVLAGLPETASMLEVWEQTSAATPYAGPPTWVHGDLHALNVLVEDGALGAVIDFGDITSGDPAVDLAIGWMLFDADVRQVFRSSMPHVDEMMWVRGHAWATYFAVVYLANSRPGDALHGVARRLVAAVATPPA